MIGIPDRMKHLKVDKRGFPVPWIVQYDRDGQPHFAVNQEHLRVRCLTHDLCSVCGGKLLRGRWFVGGALSAFHANGAFIDPPMHYECSHFALQVCPYIALPRYTKEIGLKKAQAKITTQLLIEHTMMPGRPHGDLFVAVMARNTLVSGNDNCKPAEPFIRVEYWVHGKQLPDALGRVIVAEALANGPPAQDDGLKHWEPRRRRSTRQR
jgi:hypothetical protein